MATKLRGMLIYLTGIIVILIIWTLVGIIALNIDWEANAGQEWQMEEWMP